MPEHFDVTNGYLVEADPGVRLRLGAFAIEGLTGGVRILDEQITSSDSVLYEDNYDNVCGYFDFDVFELPDAGQSVRIVIPLREPIPSAPTYRLFMPALTYDSRVAGRADEQYVWATFIRDGGVDSIMSSPGEAGYCYPPGQDEFRDEDDIPFIFKEGMNEGGDYCVQLTVKDGGPNDADGIANGVVKLTGGIGKQQIIKVVTVGTGGGAGGGCSASNSGNHMGYSYCRHSFFCSFALEALQKSSQNFTYTISCNRRAHHIGLCRRNS